MEEFVQVVRFKLDPEERLGQMNTAAVQEEKEEKLPSRYETFQQKSGSEERRCKAHSEELNGLLHPQQWDYRWNRNLVLKVMWRPSDGGF